jgi:hypothetical protein
LQLLQRLRLKDWVNNLLVVMWCWGGVNPSTISLAYSSLEEAHMAAPKIMQQGRVVPWLYVLPALIVILVFIVYPTVNTVVLSFRDRRGEQPASVDCVEGQPCWGNFENYRYALTHPDMTTALKNNALWLLIMVPAVVAIGLLIAVLADRVKYEALVKAIIFMPMAISFVGASVIWRFMYNIETGSGEQVGVLNAILVVGRILYDHPLGCVEGASGGSARGGPGGWSHGVDGLLAHYVSYDLANGYGSVNDDGDYCP